MEIDITIQGRLTIPDDDLDSIKSQGVADLATILIRHGKNITTDVRELYESGKRKAKADNFAGIKK